MPMAIAVDSTPANSTTPKYHVDTRRLCTCERYSERFDSWNRRDCSPSRPYAWITRTPLIPSCMLDRFSPTRSRTVR